MPFIIIIILTSILIQDQSRVWTAASQQHEVDNPPLAFSHHKALEAVFHPWECWNEFLVSECPSRRQPAKFREETLESGNLFNGSRILPLFTNADISCCRLLTGRRLGRMVTVYLSVCKSLMNIHDYVNLFLWWIGMTLEQQLVIYYSNLSNISSVRL